jgi:putative transposase
MGQRKEIVRVFVSKGLRVLHAVHVAGLKKSTYYYKSNGNPQGKQPSSYTAKSDGQMVSNTIVLKDIIDIITPDYHDYGYQVVTHQLRRRGYIINFKKVYRIMKEQELLHKKIEKRGHHNKLYIKQTVPPLECPFATVEADIKYVYIHEQNKNAFLLTFLCTFSRFAAVWELNYSMKSGRIIELVKALIDHPILRQYAEERKFRVKIRTDNGPQFIAKNLAEVLGNLQIEHEFINPGTPQENGHIESFHNTVTRLVCNRNVFSDLYHSRRIFQEFFQAYNYTRVMKSLLYYSPFEFLSIWKSGFIEVKKTKNNKESFFFREKPTSSKMVGLSAKGLFGINKINNFEHAFINQSEISPVL